VKIPSLKFLVPCKTCTREAQPGRRRGMGEKQALRYCSSNKQTNKQTSRSGYHATIDVAHGTIQFTTWAEMSQPSRVSMLCVCAWVVKECLWCLQSHQRHLHHLLVFVAPFETAAAANPHPLITTPSHLPTHSPLMNHARSQDTDSKLN